MTQNIILHLFERHDDAQNALINFKISGIHCASLQRMTIETETEFHMFRSVSCQQDVDYLKGWEFNEIRGLSNINHKFRAELKTRLRKPT